MGDDDPGVSDAAGRPVALVIALSIAVGGLVVGGIAGLVVGLAGGVVLGWLYERTGALLVPTLVHGCYNVVVIGILFAEWGVLR